MLAGIIEVGAFIGVSALYFAEVLPVDGEMVTLEKFDHFAAIARRNFAANGLANRITLLQGDALELIPRLPRDHPFDLAFIDGKKESYPELFEMLEPLIRPGGIVVVDDILFHSDVLNEPPRTDKGGGARRMLDLAATLANWPRTLVPISNGVLLLLLKPR